MDTVLGLSMEINRGAARNLECRIYDLQFTMYDFLGSCKLLLLFFEIGISFYFTQIDADRARRFRRLRGAGVEASS